MRMLHRLLAISILCALRREPLNMSAWDVVLPDATTNLITNPSVETGLSGYTTVGGTLGQSSAQQRRGAYALAVTPTAGLNDGVYYALTLSATTQHTFSVDVLG